MVHDLHCPHSWSLSHFSCRLSLGCCSLIPGSNPYLLPDIPSSYMASGSEQDGTSLGLQNAFSAGLPFTNCIPVPCLDLCLMPTVQHGQPTAHGNWPPLFDQYWSLQHLSVGYLVKPDHHEGMQEALVDFLQLLAAGAMLWLWLCRHFHSKRSLLHNIITFYSRQIHCRLRACDTSQNWDLMFSFRVFMEGCSLKGDFYSCWKLVKLPSFVLCFFLNSLSITKVFFILMDIFQMLSELW